MPTCQWSDGHFSPNAPEGRGFQNTTSPGFKSSVLRTFGQVDNAESIEETDARLPIGCPASLKIALTVYAHDSSPGNRSPR